MSRHRYPFSALVKDYVKAGLGLAVSATPLFIDGVSAIIFYIFLALTLLLLVFGARTVLRHITLISVSETGVRADGPLGASVDWTDLRELRLRYYSTRRDRERGWMDLRLKGRNRTLRIESTIGGFEHIVRTATERAERRGLELGALTRTNLRAMGITGPEQEMPRYAQEVLEK